MVNQIIPTRKENLFRDCKYVGENTWNGPLPFPFTQSTWDCFFIKYAYYTPLYTDFRQVYGHGEIPDGNYRMYFFHDVAYAVKWEREDPKLSVVYRLGCNHDWEVIATGRCYSKSRCRICGTITEVDSSD